MPDSQVAFRWVLLKMILYDKSLNVPPADMAFIAQTNRRFYKYLIQEATNKINLNRICYFLTTVHSSTGNASQLLNFIEKQLRLVPVENIGRYLKILMEYTCVESEGKVERLKLICRVIKGLLIEGDYRNEKPGERKSPKIERQRSTVNDNYNTEKRLIMELAVQWLAKMAFYS